MGSLLTVPSEVKLDNKVSIITGANTGIGYETAKDFAARNAHVILACRNKEKGENAVNRIKEEVTKSDPNIKLEDIKIEFMELDLSSLNSVRNFVKEFKSRDLPLHLLINNAGIMNTPYGKTQDGFEQQFGTNHLGHFLLTNLLLDDIKKSAPARIINVSSSAHFMGKINFDDLMSEKSYGGWAAYGQSKLANVMFTYELARKLEGTGVTVNAVHPGAVATELGRHTFYINFISGVFRSPYKGALTTIYVAVSPEASNITGKYWADTVVKSSSSASYNVEDQKKLWDISAKLVGLDENSSKDEQN
jgi:retinol dehydrogenase-12